MDGTFKKRLSLADEAGMVAVAVIFDILGFASKILTLLGLTLAGGVIGAIACYYVNIEAPKACSIAGAIAGGAASLTGIGTVISLKVGMLMTWLASTALSLLGYAVIIGWLWFKGVPILSGKSAGEKMAASIIAPLISAVPYVGSLVPEITCYTVRMIYLTRREDKENAKAEQESYTKQVNSIRVERKYVRTAETY